MMYLRTPSMAGVQGGCVVLLYTLIHTQVAHFRVSNLKSQKYGMTLNFNFKILCTRPNFAKQHHLDPNADILLFH